MFKRGSPFTPPQIPGSKKVFRQQTVTVNSNSNSKPRFQNQMVQQDVFQKKRCQLSSGLQITASSVDQKFCFQLLTPSQQDNTLFWSYNLTNQVAGQYSRRLIMRQFYTIGRSLSQNQIAQTIYVLAQNVPGYMDKNGTITNRVCALQISQIQVYLDDTQKKVYDVLYKQTQDASWQIPFNLGQLQFKLSYDDTIRQGQINNPIICQFDIRHSGK